MKKIITLLIALALVFSLCFSFTSCKKKYNEEEVLAAARELIEKSQFLNEIYWGRGIPYIPSSISLYCEADLMALSEMGFFTIEELKNITQEVFTASYCENIFSSAFATEKTDENFYYFPRYYQKYDDAEQKEPVNIMVYSKFENMLPDNVEYLYDTLAISHSEKDTVYVKIKAVVTRDEDKVQVVENVIALKEGINGWRLDSPTYLKYNDKKAEYEDLLKK